MWWHPAEKRNISERVRDQFSRRMWNEGLFSTKLVFPWVLPNVICRLLTWRPSKLSAEAPKRPNFASENVVFNHGTTATKGPKCRFNYRTTFVLLLFCRCQLETFVRNPEHNRTGILIEKFWDIRKNICKLYF